MQEFDKQFNKPVDNVILDRPTGTSEAPRKDTSSEEQAPRFSKKQKWIAALTGAALFASITGGIVAANNGEKPAESPANTSEPLEPAPVNPVEQPTTGEGQPTTPEVPTTGELIVPLETLAAMNPEQITQATTVPVESVLGPDGTADWNMYAKKLPDIIELYLNAGSSESEMSNINENSSAPADAIRELANKYEGPIELGFSRMIDGNTLDLLRGTHNNQLFVANIANLRGSEMPVTSYEYVASEIVNSSSEYAVIDLTTNISDNFFSSGAVTDFDAQIIDSLKRSADRNENLNNIFTAEVIGENIYLTNISSK